MKNVTLVAALLFSRTNGSDPRIGGSLESTAFEARNICKACGDDPDAEVFGIRNSIGEVNSGGIVVIKEEGSEGDVTIDKRTNFPR